MLIGLRLRLILCMLKLICFISKPEGVIELTKTKTKPVKKPAKRTKKKVKKPPVHKRANNLLGTKTECGISLYDVGGSNNTWRGVTCKRCLNTLAYNKYLIKKKGGK